MEEEIRPTSPTSEDAKSNVSVMNTILIATIIFFLIYYLTTRGKQKTTKPPPTPPPPPVLVEEEAIREETIVEEQVVMVTEKKPPVTVATATASTNTDAVVEDRRAEECGSPPVKDDAVSQTEASIIIASWTCDYCASEWRSCNLFDPHVGSPYARRYRTELKLDVKARPRPENMMSVEMPHMLRVSVDAASSSSNKENEVGDEEPHISNVDVVAEEGSLRSD